MTDETRTNSGIFSKNEKKQAPTHADIRATLTSNAALRRDQRVRLDGWHDRKSDARRSTASIRREPAQNGAQGSGRQRVTGLTATFPSGDRSRLGR